MNTARRWPRVSARTDVSRLESAAATCTTCAQHYTTYPSTVPPRCCVLMRYVSLNGTALMRYHSTVMRVHALYIAQWFCWVLMRYHSMVLLRAHALMLNGTAA